jgi:hypothetical protein
MSIILHTDAQAELLGKNPHLVPVADLGDGDILVLDKQQPNGELEIGHFGPYVLTTEGYVQDVNMHYHIRHGMRYLPVLSQMDTVNFSQEKGQ